jgi:hypothetical protein
MAPPQVEPRGAWSTGLTDAIRFRDSARPGQPGKHDVPVSTFPMTPAARAALTISKANAARKRRVREASAD